MDKCLSKIGYDFWSKTILLPIDLQRVVDSEFLVDNECITLKSLTDASSSPKLDTSLQKCEWESDQTHFHPDSFIDTDDEIEYLKLALECGKVLIKRLQNEFKDKSFRLVISFNETETNETGIEIYGSSTVRFYQIRQDADNVMKHKNLDDFESDAVIEIEKTAGNMGLAEQTG